jgi:undecaprenyl-diphosphatase
MLNELILAFIQAATEYLPVSSSGHLALFSLLTNTTPNLFLITVLHIASLIAVMIFLRKEIYSLITFKKETLPLWRFWIIATIPAVIIGLLFSDVVEQMFSAPIFLGITFIFTGIVLFLTKFASKGKARLNNKKAITIGLMQALALFPGISRSGMTISTGLLQGLPKEKAARFSFLLFIPLAVGALALEAFKLPELYINSSLIASFFLCIILSILFLNLLVKIIKKDMFWMFSFYCWAIGLITIILTII